MMCKQCCTPCSQGERKHPAKFTWSLGSRQYYVNGWTQQSQRIFPTYIILSDKSSNLRVCKVKYSQGKSFSNPALKCRMWGMMTCTELSQRKYSLILGEIKCFFLLFFSLLFLHLHSRTCRKFQGHTNRISANVGQHFQQMLVFFACWLLYCFVLFIGSFQYPRGLLERTEI